ncbi:hypothetical protein EDB89DRAFT_2203536 [Lactarius sanguifluus]|nr:hypothetical protein EDB89DRAFT_2203536 [Lactarius sanguifluus]
MAYHYKHVHFRSLEPASWATQPVTLDAIATALSDPIIFGFDPLFQPAAIFATQAQADKAYHYKLVHIRSLDPAPQATQLVELDAIATPLSDPAIFDFDQLFKAHHGLRAVNAPALRAPPDALEWRARRLHCMSGSNQRWVIGGKLSIRPATYQLFSFLPGERPHIDAVINKKRPALPSKLRR